MDQYYISTLQPAFGPCNSVAPDKVVPNESQNRTNLWTWWSRWSSRKHGVCQVCIVCHKLQSNKNLKRCNLLGTIKIVILVRCHDVTSNFRDFIKAINNKHEFWFFFPLVTWKCNPLYPQWLKTYIVSWNNNFVIL